jgi:hypothetical protein
VCGIEPRDANDLQNASLRIQLEPMNTVLLFGGAAFGVSVACWGVGALLVSSKQPLVAMLAGWCVFLLLCTVPWFAGIPAVWVRPLFWIFFIVGIVAMVRRQRWADLIAALVCVVVVSLLLGWPYLIYDKVLGYGAHGTDMWGYINGAEWLQHHSIRNLPEPGVTPMRFNWIWYVFTTRERPLVYESLACLGVATGLSPLMAYVAYPVALMASLAMAMGRTPGVFGVKYWPLALLPGVLMVFHPLIVLHWIAGFASGSIVGLFVALAFAAIVVAESAAETEALVLGLMMLVFCGGLYSPQFMLVGVVIAGAPIVVRCGFNVWSDGWRQFLRQRPGRLTTGVLLAAAVVAAGTVAFSGDQFMGRGAFRWSEETLAQLLGIFGGTSPYAWLYYRAMEPWDQHPFRNPVGIAALAVMVVLFGAVAWRRWQSNRDVRVPVLLGICLAGLLHVGGDERATMAKAMPIFGVTLLILMAAISCELRPRWLAVMAMIVACMPSVRSRGELQEMLQHPYILCTEDNLNLSKDGENWMILAVLYFQEDSRGFDWTKNPRMFKSMTVFLSEPARQSLSQKHHVPMP